MPKQELSKNPDAATAVPTTLLEAALYYLSLGWALLPLRPGTKQPHTKLLPTNRKTGKPSWKPLAVRPASEPEVRDWFRRDPNCNLGLICGEASGGIVVVDFDMGIPPLPLTPVVRTRRGVHVYTKSDVEVRTRKISGGEIRGENAYVVLPPSTQSGIFLYAWMEGLSPVDVEMMEFTNLQRRLPELQNSVIETKETVSPLPHTLIPRKAYPF